jgi:MFS family permease
MRLAIFAACLVSMISFGVRGAFGLFMEPVPRALGLGLETYAFAMALQNLCWGIGQPFAGALLGRYGSAKILTAGVLLYASGTALSAFATTPLAIYATAGVMAGFGMALASYITALAALATIAPPERRAWAMSIGTAAGSVGQFVLPPVAQSFMNAFGWQATLLFVAGLLLATLAFVPALRRGQSAQSATALDLPAFDVVRKALSHRSYVLLVLGFFTCGFQLAFIQFHLPAYLTGIGYSATFAAWTIGMIGLFNIVGSYIAAPVGARIGYKYFLSAMYLGRTALLCLLVLFHDTPAMVLAVAGALGVLWLAAAPTTSGLVMTMFGVRYMPVLFGVTFLSHQLGSFAGVWMGGLLYAHTGSYTVSWIACAALGVLAAALHLPIQERESSVFALPQAARA